MGGFIGVITSGTAMIIYIVIIITIFSIYALDMVNNELRERNLESLLYKKIEIEDYLKLVGEFGAKSKNKTRITKYNIYKAMGYYYKGEYSKALEWLELARAEVETGNDEHNKIMYNTVIIKILFRIGYNENVEKIYQEKIPLINNMLLSVAYKYNALYITGVHEALEGQYKDSYERLLEAKRYAQTRLDRIMTTYELSKVCLELSKMEEAEQYAEEVMNSKKSAKNVLFIYEDLEKIIKERRSQSNNISTVDKDLEEQDRLEALEKMNKEVEEAINNNEELKKVDSEDTTNVRKEDDDVRKLREEEELKSQLEEMTKNLHDEMLIQNNLNK